MNLCVYSKLSDHVKASIWFTCCNLILKAFAFFSLPIFSRLLSSSEYGLYSVFLSLEQIIITLATWEIALSAYQKGLFKYKSNVYLFTISTLLFSNIITLVFFIIILFYLPYFCNFTGFSKQIFLLLFIYMIVQPSYSCWLIEMRTMLKYKKATIVSVLGCLLGIIIPLISVLLLERTADVLFRYHLISSIVFFSFFYLKRCNFVYLFRYLTIVRHQWNYIAKFQLPILIHALSYVILAQSDRVMIEKFVGASQAAYYTVAYNIASAVAVFQYSINQTLVPWRLDKLEKKKYMDIYLNTSPLLLFIGGIVLLFIFISPEIIKLFFTAEYFDSIWCMPPITMSIYFMFLYTLFVWVENYYEKTKYVAIVSIFCALLNVVLNYALIDVCGYIVCSYTTLFSYIVFCLGHYFFMKRTLNENGVIDLIYNINSCIYISFFLLFAMAIATFCYYTFFVRYLVLICVIVSLCFFKDYIKESFRLMKKV